MQNNLQKETDVFGMTHLPILNLERNENGENTSSES